MRGILDAHELLRTRQCEQPLSRTGPFPVPLARRSAAALRSPSRAAHLLRLQPRIQVVLCVELRRERLRARNELALV